MWAPYVCTSAYKHDVVVIKMGANIHGVLLWVPIIQIYSIRLAKSVYRKYLKHKFCRFCICKHVVSMKFVQPLPGDLGKEIRKFPCYAHKTMGQLLC